jgi:hypothetical protein
MSENPNQLDKAAIEAEYRRYKTEEVLHNTEMQKRILASWKQESPKMWTNLQAQGLTDKMAFVAQERMWRRKDELIKAGYPVTDAREQAEREELMLDPENEDDLATPGS